MPPLFRTVSRKGETPLYKKESGTRPHFLTMTKKVVMHKGYARVRGLLYHSHLRVRKAHSRQNHERSFFRN